MEKISVIVPIYNTEKYLKRCIDSILTQTHYKIELLLVDDGSTDRSGEICEEYARIDDRVKVFHQDNQGQATARNYALDWLCKNSDSQWISFVDSDDWIHPEMLQILYRAAKDNKTKISICGYGETYGSKIEVCEAQKKVRILNTADFYCDCGDGRNVVPVGKLYHRDCFNDIRFPKVRACEDEFVTYRVLFQFSEVPVVDAPLYAYFMSENSTMRTDWSPKRIVGIKAFEEQIKYFQKLKLQKVLENRIRMYLWGIESQLEDVRQYKDALPKYERMLKRKLGRFLVKWKRMYPFKDNISRYETAFPKAMRLYWTVQGIKRKFTRRK